MDELTPTEPTSTAMPPAGVPGRADRGRSGWLPEELVEGPAASSELLVELIDTLRTIDRLTAKATGLLEMAHATGEVEEITGVPVELWLAAAGRRTRADRRMLTTAAVWRSKLPQLADAFDGGRVSWAQLRAVLCACLKLPAHLLPAVDDALADEVEVLGDAEPDDLVHVVSRAVASIETPPPSAEVAEEPPEPGHGFLAIQPRLDGSGGSLYGETDSYGLAVLTEALDRDVPPPDGRHRDHIGAPVDEQRAEPSRRHQARRRLDALIHLAEASLTDPGAGPAVAPGDARSNGRRPAGSRPTPTLLLTMSLETLLRVSNQDAELLTTLTGGRLKVDASTARRLVDEAGARLRTVVVEETGQILGVGRARYRPPGWLREALLARDATCRAPICATAARRSDLDHAESWEGEDGPGGSTDVVNLAHLCRTDHGAKSRDGWQVRGRNDGRANGLHRWYHPRSGLTIDTAPTTRRLSLHPPPGTDPPDPPDPPDQPEPSG
jgi:hypothetical protein